MDLELKPRKLARALGIAMAVLVMLHILACLPIVFMNREYPIGFFSLDGEQNLPAMFSTALLWSNALLTGCITWAAWGTRSDRIYWLGLALAFVAMGIDESTMLHERLTESGRELLNASGFFYYAWIVPYMIALIIFVLLYLRFFLRLPASTRKHIVFAAVLYVSGAIGFEMLGGAWTEGHGKGVIYYLLSTLEEALEMSGCIVFIYAFSNYIARYLPDCRLRIVPDESH